MEGTGRIDLVFKGAMPVSGDSCLRGILAGAYHPPSVYLPDALRPWKGMGCAALGETAVVFGCRVGNDEGREA